MTIVATLWKIFAYETKSTRMGLTMATSANMQTLSIDSTMSTREYENYNVKGKRTWVYSQKTWNLPSFAIVAKALRTTSCKAIHFSPWVQQKIWIHVRSKGWLQMQCNTPRTKGWERPNLMCNKVEKTFKAKREKKMIRRNDNKTPAPTPNFTHNLKHI
jgi:hypothetical protein